MCVKAAPDVRQCFDAAVEARREDLLASRKGTLPAGMKIEDPSVLYMPGTFELSLFSVYTCLGTKDGDTKIIAEGLGACAYVWSSSDSEWKKIGDVLGTQPGELASASKVEKHFFDVFVFLLCFLFSLYLIV